MLTINPARETDPATVQASMTDAERQRLHIEFGWSAAAEMGLCYAQSDKAYTVCLDKRPILMFGVYRSSTDDRYGKLWFIGSQSAYAQSPKEFALKSYRFLPELAAGYEWVGSVVSCKDSKLKRWLRFLGFSKTAEYPEDGQEEYLIKL